MATRKQTASKQAVEAPNYDAIYTLTEKLLPGDWNPEAAAAGGPIVLLPISAEGASTAFPTDVRAARKQKKQFIVVAGNHRLRKAAHEGIDLKSLNLEIAESAASALSLYRATNNVIPASQRGLRWHAGMMLGALRSQALGASAEEILAECGIGLNWHSDGAVSKNLAPLKASKEVIKGLKNPDSKVYDASCPIKWSNLLAALGNAKIAKGELPAARAYRYGHKVLAPAKDKDTEEPKGGKLNHVRTSCGPVFVLGDTDAKYVLPVVSSFNWPREAILEGIRDRLQSEFGAVPAAAFCLLHGVALLEGLSKSDKTAADELAKAYQAEATATENEEEVL